MAAENNHHLSITPLIYSWVSLLASRLCDMRVRNKAKNKTFPKMELNNKIVLFGSLKFGLN